MHGDAPCVNLLIGTAEGIDRIDEIMSVQGIDLIALGLNDLSTSMGYPGEPGHAEVVGACRRVTEVCGKHGISVIAGGAGSPDVFAKLVDLGIAPLAFVGMDTDMLCDILAQRKNKWLEDGS